MGTWENERMGIWENEDAGTDLGDTWFHPEQWIV